MRDHTVQLDDGREVAVAHLSDGQIARALDAVARGDLVPGPGERGTAADLRERLLIERIARELGL